MGLPGELSLSSRFLSNATTAPPPPPPSHPSAAHVEVLETRVGEAERLARRRRGGWRPLPPEQHQLFLLRVRSPNPRPSASPLRSPYLVPELVSGCCCFCCGWCRFGYASLERLRQRLPVYKYRKAILYLVERHATTIVVGETGSGKSTQIPQVRALGFSLSRTSIGSLHRLKIYSVGEQRKEKTCLELHQIISFLPFLAPVKYLFTHHSFSSLSIT